jgi:hypothetical protein
MPRYDFMHLCDVTWLSSLPDSARHSTIGYLSPIGVRAAARISLSGCQQNRGKTVIVELASSLPRAVCCSTYVSLLPLALFLSAKIPIS